jgi:2-polyprenyl-3-methyl-5-hydroxy-6-metoxy-1,4-benzoquinol methylase
MGVYDDHPGFAIDAATAEAYRADIEALLPSFVHNWHVLELGCGSGVFTQFLATQGMTVVGGDQNEMPLTEARQRLPETAFVTGDFESAQFVEQIQSEHPLFDFIATRYVIHELADPIETFRLWKQLLKPDGKLLLIENAWIRQDWGWSDWGKRTDQLPLACTQTWATAAYCLSKAGFNVTACSWMHQVNRLEAVRLVSGFRLYGMVAEAI